MGGSEGREITAGDKIVTVNVDGVNKPVTLLPEHFGENCNYIMYYIVVFPKDFDDASISAKAFLKGKGGAKKYTESFDLGKLYE